MNIKFSVQNMKGKDNGPITKNRKWQMKPFMNQAGTKIGVAAARSLNSCDFSFSYF